MYNAKFIEQSGERFRDLFFQRYQNKKYLGIGGVEHFIPADDVIVFPDYNGMCLWERNIKGKIIKLLFNENILIVFLPEGIIFVNENNTEWKIVTKEYLEDLNIH